MKYAKFLITLFLFVSFLVALDNKGELTEIVKNSEQELVREILENYNLNVNDINNNNETPLMYAVLKEDLQLVKTLLSKGANINAQDKDGNTALMIAVVKKNHILVDFLLGNGADVNISRNTGKTALYYAKNDYQLFEILINRGAKYFYLDSIKNFSEIVDLSQQPMFVNLLVKKDLVKLYDLYWLYVLAKNNNDKKLLALIPVDKAEKFENIESFFVELVEKEHLSVGDFLSKYNFILYSQLDSLTKDSAIDMKQKKLINYLAQVEFQIYQLNEIYFNDYFIRDEISETLLSIAFILQDQTILNEYLVTIHNDNILVKFLELEYMAKLFSRDYFLREIKISKNDFLTKQDPLIVAICNNDLIYLENYLLVSTANVTNNLIENKELAFKTRNKDLIDFFINNNFLKQTELRKNYLELINIQWGYLNNDGQLNKSIDPNVMSDLFVVASDFLLSSEEVTIELKKKLLLLALFYGQDNVAKNILEDDNFDFNQLFHDKNDPLNYPLVHWAIRGGQLAMLDFLKEKGFKFNIKYDEEQETLLMIAAYYGDLKIIRYLVGEGLDVSAISGDGYSVITYAIAGNNYDAVDYLIKAGANLDLKLPGKDGQLITLVEFANRFANEKIIQLLKDVDSK